MSRSPLQFHLRGPSSRARSLPVLGSIAQAIHAFGTEATDPFADGLRGRIELARSRGVGHAAIHNGTNHFLSTFGVRRASYECPSVLRESLRFGNISVRFGPIGQPPESSQLAGSTKGLALPHRQSVPGGAAWQLAARERRQAWGEIRIWPWGSELPRLEGIAACNLPRPQPGHEPARALF